MTCESFGSRTRDAVVRPPVSAGGKRGGGQAGGRTEASDPCHVLFLSVGGLQGGPTGRATVVNAVDDAGGFWSECSIASVC